MKLHLQTRGQQNLVTAYGAGFIMVNGIRHERSLIVTPDTLLTDWEATTFDTLTESQLARLAAIDCDVLLLGTGNRLQFPKPALTRTIHEARIGLEVMDTHAACRTYNILLAESRKVAAALLIA